MIDLLYMEKDGGTDDGASLMLTMVDVCSRHVFTTPLKDKTGDETAKALLLVLANHPEINPTTIIHDHGSECKGIFSAIISIENLNKCGPKKGP